MKVGPVLFLVLSTVSVSHSQSRPGQSGASARASLTVTATVESSVWLVSEPDGTREVVVANAPDPKESFSRTPAGKRKRAAPARSANSKLPATDNKSAMRTEMVQRAEPQPVIENDAAVLFSFPTAGKRFDVTQETQVMDIADGNEDERRPVEIITIVAQ
jgi:hypothetical protein